MKTSFLMLFLVFSANVFSQSTIKSILLKDAETNIPIEEATVYIAKTKQTLLSNSQGKVSFDLTGISNIQITHASYAKISIRSTFLKETENIIYLKNTVNNLDEIIITKLPPQKILKSLIENSIKRLTIPARLKVYAREFFKLNGSYAYYNDGLMNFQLFGKPKNFKTDILVEQNRSYGFTLDDIIPDVLGYNLNNIMENYYNFKYLNPLLEASANRKYDFIIKGIANNNDNYKIIATPIDNTKELLDDFIIIYDKNKKLITEVSSFVSPFTIANVKEKTSIGSKNVYKSMFKTTYRVDNSNYYLLSSKEEIGFEKIEKDKKNNIEVRNYLVTNNFSNQNYSYKQTDVFKDKTLNNKKNTILNNYWEISGLTATDEELAIINMLVNMVN